MQAKKNVDIIIPTYKPDKKFWLLLERLNKQNYPINKIIVINTEEQYMDQTCLEKFEKVEVHHITMREFDHGSTRNNALKYSNSEFVVFMTQDAIPANSALISELLKPFVDQNVYVTYARQVPNKNSMPMERFTREFNYPDYDIEKSIDDVEKFGIKAFFSSDVCAAYRRSGHDKLGGFKKTVLNEDSIFAAETIFDGKKVYYCSKAKVYHSHNYTYFQQFQRNFDIGVSHRDYQLIFLCVQSEEEGIRLVMKTCKYLIRQGKWYLVPDAFIRSGFKYLGYWLGKRYRRLPKSLILSCTSTKNYWK